MKRLSFSYLLKFAIYCLLIFQALWLVLIPTWNRLIKANRNDAIHNVIAMKTVSITYFFKLFIFISNG